MAFALAALFYAGLGVDKLKTELPFTFFFVMTASAIAFALLVFVERLSKVPCDESSLKTKFYVLFECFVRRAFKSQSNDTWSTILQGVRPIFSRHCSKPTVIVLLVEPGASQTAESLASQLALVVATAFDTTLTPDAVREKSILRGERYTSPHSFSDFSVRLRTTLSEIKCAVLVNFESIDGTVAKTLCILLDDDVLVLRGAVIILLNVGACLLDAKRGLSEIAEKHISLTMRANMYTWRITEELQRAICGRAAFVTSEEPFKKST